MVDGCTDKKVSKNVLQNYSQKLKKLFLYNCKCVIKLRVDFGVSLKHFLRFLCVQNSAMVCVFALAQPQGRLGPPCESEKCAPRPLMV